MSVLLETTMGDIVIDLFTDERPRACLNFLKLCKIKFYNFCLFHSVQRNFTAQTGDPTGTGKGGESVFRVLYGDQAKFFEAEVKPRMKHKNKGTVSMVNNGDNMHGSQFFITLDNDLDYLDGVHTVFGEVSEGFEILDKINETICNEDNRPYQDIRISHTVILDDPFDDPKGLPIPDRSPEPTKEQLASGLIGVDEEVDDTQGKTIEEIEDMIEEREQKAGTQLLEMIGDLPDADVKPPDNVLFVCKLNPVTTDEDLEIIFSRFGTILSCEVIRDQQNGESLQYAFIEFEKAEDCERAYFKMDNVLIDDRRIHVDFSQSVSKVKWQKKGGHPVMPEKKTEKPKYSIKEKAKKSKYDLVFNEISSASDEETPEKKIKPDKERYDHNDSKRSRRDSESERRHDKNRKERDEDSRHIRKSDREVKESERRRKEDRDDRKREEGNERRKDTRRSDDDHRSHKKSHKSKRSPSPQKSRDRDRKHRDRDDRRHKR